MANKQNQDFFNAIFQIQFGFFRCFLCGARLGKKNRSDEHVIPKWIQRRYKLENQKITLLNNTTIPYRKLTVPCCFNCNNRYLQPLEKKVSRAVAKGASAVRKLEHHDLFLWLGKIFYGLLYRELFLPWDLSREKRGNITSKEILKQYEMHHFFLQSIRFPIRFLDFSPASILIVNTQAPNDPRLCWDFHDELSTLCIACRMSHVGIIAVLQDGGSLMPKFPLLNLRRRKLHPIQFRELFAKVVYKAKLLNRTPKYVLVDGNQKSVMQLPLAGYSAKPLFNDWHQHQYAQVLSQVTGIPLSYIYQPPNKVASWLWNSDGSGKSLPLSKYPIHYTS